MVVHYMIITNYMLGTTTVSTRYLTFSPIYYVTMLAPQKIEIMLFDNVKLFDNYYDLLDFLP